MEEQNNPSVITGRGLHNDKVTGLIPEGLTIHGRR